MFLLFGDAVACKLYTQQYSTLFRVILYHQ